MINWSIQMRITTIHFNHSSHEAPLKNGVPMAQFARTNLPTLKKTASYYVMHIGVALVVAYAVTGSLAISVTLSLVEPTVQAVAFFFHEKAWQRLARRPAPQPEALVA